MSTLCAKCGFNNPPGMRYCGNCGTRMPVLALTEAGPLISPATVEFGAMMGADLAERMRHAGVEAAGQHRIVTVLFADISGFTALAERIDGEDLYHLVQNYIRVLADNVYKYEGVVDKITGDGLMALFGAPIAHENNAERAVRCALDMQDDLRRWSKGHAAQYGKEMLVRIGLHSGAVIVGGVGANDLVLNYTAIGDTVNLAHRIEEAAAPGSILISDSVYRQVRTIIDCQQISMLTPKGISHPVTAYQVIACRTRPSIARGLEGLHAPMVGRDADLAQLKGVAVDLLVSARSQFVLITGDAGLGKSRLVREFKASLDVSQLRILEGQSLAYRKVSYWLIRDLLYNYLALPASTPPLQVRERLHQVLFDAIGPQAADTLPYIESLMALPLSDAQVVEWFGKMDAGRLRQQIFLAVHDLFLHESRRNPVLVIFEDLHWADEASLELLAFLIDVLRDAPVFFLAVTRQVQSGALEKAILWAGQNLGNRFKHIRLQSLSRDQSKQLLNLLLSIPNLPDRLREQILLRAAGIPFYLEEILRMLMDQGVIQNIGDLWQVSATAQVATLGVPDTLQQLILARFDRLTPLQRKILQVAAVIGKNFSIPILEAILPDEAVGLRAQLDDLIERDFILPLTTAAETELTFRHMLMSDAIYSTLLRKDRSALHGQVAEAIERLCAGRLDEQVELLANHYRWSTHLDRAVHYQILAGQLASHNHINQQARAHFETALELLYQIEYLPIQAFNVHAGLGDCLVFAGEYPEARGHYEWALQALRPDQRGESSTMQRSIARTYERQGDYERALEHLTLAQCALAGEDPEDQIALAQIWNDTAWIKLRRGGVNEADDLLQRALKLVENSSAYDVIASIYNRLGGIAYNRGDWEQAAGFLRRSIAIREENRDVVNLSTSLNNLGLLEIEMGQYHSALENLQRSHELKLRLGQAEGIAMALNNLGWLRILRGELDAARSVLQKALELAQQIGYTSLIQQIMRSFGELYLSAQDWGSALIVLTENLTALENLGDSDQLIDSYRQLGEASLGCGNLEQALLWADKAGALIDMTQKDLRGRVAMQRGEYLRFRGLLCLQIRDYHSAEHYLNESIQVFQNQRSSLHLARAIYATGLLAAGCDDPLGARQRFAEAAEIFKRIGAMLEAKRAEAVAGVSLAV